MATKPAKNKRFNLDDLDKINLTEAPTVSAFEELINQGSQRIIDANQMDDIDYKLPEISEEKSESIPESGEEIKENKQLARIPTKNKEIQNIHPEVRKIKNKKSTGNPLVAILQQEEVEMRSIRLTKNHFDRLKNLQKFAAGKVTLQKMINAVMEDALRNAEAVLKNLE